MSQEKTSLVARDILLNELINDDDYPEGYLERIPEEKKDRVNKKINKIKSGLYAIAPIICRGPQKCPFITHCPLTEGTRNDGSIDYGPLEDYPMNHACVLESTFIRLKTIEYIQYLNVDPNNPIEMSIINDLCLIDLYKNRATIILSAGDKAGQGQDFLRIDVTQIIDNGNGDEAAKEILQIQEHPALAVIDKLEKRRQKLIEQLAETRTQKIKRAEKQGQLKDSSRLQSQLEEIKRVLKEKVEVDKNLPAIPLKD